MIRACRLARNQSSEKAARRRPRRRRAWWSVPSASASTPQGHVDVAEERGVRPHQSAALHRPRRYNIPLVTPKLVQYEAPGWGIGELWLEGDRVVWCGAAPSVAGRVRFRGHGRGRPGPRPRRDGSRRSSRARPTTSPTSSSTSTTGSTATARGRCAPCPRGEVVTYGELAALAGRPGAARAAGTFCARNRFAPFVPCHRVVAAGGIGSFGSLGVELQAPPARARRCRSLTTCATSSPRSLPRRRCCSLAELSALFHSAGTWHLRGHGELAVHLDLASARPPRGARSRCCAASASTRRSARTAARPSTAPRATSCTSPSTRVPPRCCARRACCRARGAPLERPPKRVVGRSCCRGAYLRGALLGAGSLSGPRAPHLELRAASAGRRAASSSRSPQPEGIPLRVARSAAPTPLAYAKSSETIGGLLAVAGASETALRLDEHAVMAGTKAEANRLANADGANVKRTVDAARRAARGDRPARRRRPSRRSCREIAQLRQRHPSLSLTELAQKCRPQITKAAAHHRMAVLQATRGDAGLTPASTRTRSLTPPARRAVARRRAGRRGSSEEDLPLRLNHAPDRWRRTGSESDAGRAWTRRRGVSLRRRARVPDYLQVVLRFGVATRALGCTAVSAKFDELRVAAGRDQRPRSRDRDPRVGTRRR